MSEAMRRGQMVQLGDSEPVGVVMETSGERVDVIWMMPWGEVRQWQDIADLRLLGPEQFDEAE